MLHVAITINDAREPFFINGIIWIFDEDIKIKLKTVNKNAIQADNI